ncbi:MAG TPA: ATP-binding cassette domain-containing protein [Mycobacteriales bacterium]|nr:ATP-binding cassette domain-containing protein [Mycobacteriales bacterium]
MTAASETPRLSCEGVTVRFGGLVAVDQATVTVPPGQIAGLVGPNGAGKSTLFAVLSGLLKPSEGVVRIDGQDVTRERPQVRAKLGLARTFQHPELFAGLTVREHIVLAHRARHSPSRTWTDLLTMGSLRPQPKDERERVDGLVRLLGLEAVAQRPAVGLPLGTARLVELGRALATAPSVLLLDEPSSGLDTTETEQFEATLQRVVQERGTSILLVEHDVELVMRMCATVHVIDFGVMIAQGTPAQVQSDPKVRAAYLGEEIAPATPATPAKKARARAAAKSADAAETPAPTGTPALVVEDLCVRYGDAIGLSDLSFRLDEGRVLAVVGPNGAGKSTLARALSGLVRPASGRITYAGQDISSKHAHTIRKSGLIHLPEGRGVFRGLTVADNLRMAATGVGDRAARKAAVEKAYTLFPVLGERRKQMAGHLSGGEQQMLSLARALATSPSIIVADEMSLGLAPRLVDMVFDGLQQARADGVTVVLIEQFVHRALGFADDCLVLLHGRMAWQGAASEAGGDMLRHYLGEAVAVGA